MKFTIKHFSIDKDFSVAIENDGIRPHKATAVIEFDEDFHRVITITLNPMHLEALLNRFQDLISQEFSRGLTRCDDEIMEGVGVIKQPIITAEMQRIIDAEVASKIGQDYPEPMKF